jgi:hypothetical protein
VDNADFYNSPEWRGLSDLARSRDGNRCSVARLIGGKCSARLDAHHLQSIQERPDLALELDNLLTVCASHHPTLEACRRLLRVIRMIDMPPCGHTHPYASGKRACEERRRAAALDRQAAKLARLTPDALTAAA